MAVDLYPMAMNSEEDQLLRKLGETLDLVDGWEQLTGTLSGSWKTRDGSDLAKDDTAAHPYQVSNLAWAAMTAAVSHLACLRDSLFHEASPDGVHARIHTHGQLTLLRGALENAAMAIWLLEEEESAIRVTRRLQVDWKERSELENVREILGATSLKTMDEHFVELTAIANLIGVDPKKIKDRPGYGKIVKLAGARLPLGNGSTLASFIWKACSSIAHGEMRGSIAYLSRDVLGSSSPGMSLAAITGNIELLTVGTSIAVAATHTAFKLYEKRGGAVFTPLQPSWKI